MTDLSAFLSETGGSSKGTFRWMSPELLDPVGFGSTGRLTRESDHYALGMLIYKVGYLRKSRWALTNTRLSQVLTGLQPFHRMDSPTFILPVVRGKRPEKPPQAGSLGFSDVLWALVQLCWSPDMSSQPTARQMLDQLSLNFPDWDPPTEYPMPVENAPSATNFDPSDSSQGPLASFDQRGIDTGNLESILIGYVVVAFFLASVQDFYSGFYFVCILQTRYIISSDYCLSFLRHPWG